MKPQWIVHAICSLPAILSIHYPKVEMDAQYNFLYALEVSN
jgi:hypothetical protein